ncbi:MAG: hypothetical protein MUC64_00850 [Rubritepida sp.]|jgi:hypothetical protein|nr:hypothetical protein [Rubritepida sp.]
MLPALVERLTVPGLPEWTGLVALLVLLLLGACLLAMPFSVFGLKGRLDAIEAQLDELRAEMRALALKLPDRASPFAARDEAAPPPPLPLPEGSRSEPRITWPRRG